MRFDAADDPRNDSFRADSCGAGRLPSDIGFTSPSSPQKEGEGQTAVLDRPEEKSETRKDDGADADRYAHYVSAKEMARSRATGRPVVALCGKVWVPKHNPADYPICPECKKIYEQLQGGNN